jgi:uncharacterized repeat protein (TIGR02543 family)
MKAVEKKRKNKILYLILLTVVTAVLLAGYALAYLTDREKAQNVISIGEVTGIVTEPNWNGGNNLVPGQTVTKDPVITNQSKTNYAYVFMRVLVPMRDLTLINDDGTKQDYKTTTQLFSFLHKDGENYTDGFNLYDANDESSTSNWVELTSKEEQGINDGDTTSYVFAYRVPLAPGETTESVFDAVQIVKYLEGEIKTTDKYNIVVEGYMIQSSLVENAEGGDITEAIKKKVTNDDGTVVETIDDTVEESVLVDTLEQIYDTYVNQNSLPDYNLYTLGVDKLEVNEDGYIQIPDAETKTGYKFAFWVTADSNLENAEDIKDVTRKGRTYYISTQTEADKAKEEYGIQDNQYKESDVPAGGLTLYPVYVPITYRVRFNKSATTNNQIYQKNDFTYDVPQALDPVSSYWINNTGYEFVGWSYDVNGNVNFKDQAIVKNLTTEDGAVIDLYAIWKPNRARIRYYANKNSDGVEGKFPNGAQVNELEAVNQIVNEKNENGRVTGTVTTQVLAGTYMEPTHPTMSFAGWYSDEACTDGNEVAVDTTGVPSSITSNTMSLYAKWKNPVVTYVAYTDTWIDETNIRDWNSYTISYKWENGKNVEVDSERTDTVSPQAAPAGYRIGWSTSSARTTDDFNLGEKLKDDIIVYECHILSQSCTKAVELNYTKAPHLKNSGFSLDKTNYAVSLYGILEDEDKDGNKLPLTFGPATGLYNMMDPSAYWSHVPSGVTEKGNAHRCIHDDSWETIIEWANKDPYVYEDCMNMGTRYMTTDGTGDGVDTIYPSLYDTTYLSYRRWNGYVSDPVDSVSGFGDTSGGYPASRIRAFMNGSDDNTADGHRSNYLADMVAGKDMAGFTESQSLLATFPKELQDAIVRKAVRSDISSSDAKSAPAVTNDKLWLFSSAELIVPTDDFDDDGWAYNNQLRKNEGVGSTKETSAYSRQQLLAITQDVLENGGMYKSKLWAFSAKDTPFPWWLRSLKNGTTNAAEIITYQGLLNSQTLDYNSLGVSPGFCIGNPVSQ